MIPAVRGQRKEKDSRSNVGMQPSQRHLFLLPGEALEQDYIPPVRDAIRHRPANRDAQNVVEEMRSKINETSPKVRSDTDTYCAHCALRAGAGARAGTQGPMCPGIALPARMPQ